MENTPKTAQAEGLAWLFEMEAVNEPNVQQALCLNILKSSKRIKDVRLLVDEPNRKMLVYVELSFLGAVFQKRVLLGRAEDLIKQVLPSFQVRAINDLALFERAIQRVQ